jgi:hypothetical protein
MPAAASATNPAVTLEINLLRVTWTNSATTDATHTVYRSRGACGAYVAVASGISTPYIDYNVSNGEVYAYYIVASAPGYTDSVPTAVVRITFTGVPDQYSATLTSSDATTERNGALAVYTNAAGIPAGCGEFQRLQRLRGQATLCGK